MPHRSSMVCACPAVSADETRRVETLRRQRILDSGREDIFERIVALATGMLAVPNAAINFVDLDRQWTKTGGFHGMEVPREDSFCGWVIEARRTIVVPDARQDARFAANPMVAGPPHVVFYAGAPLWVDDEPIGTLCVFDTEPHEPLHADVMTLESLAMMARDIIVLRSATLGARELAAA